MDKFHIKIVIANIWFNKHFSEMYMTSEAKKIILFNYVDSTWTAKQVGTINNKPTN